MKNKSKKGELTIQQIITIIILISSFVVLVYFLIRLNIGKFTQDEICHNSIVLASKESILGNLAKSQIDCTTNHICISAGGECKSDYNEKIMVDAGDLDSILKAISDQMADCWWTYGEGKLIFSREYFIKSQNVCGICSKIEFDEVLKQKYLRYNQNREKEGLTPGSPLTYSNLYDFLGNHYRSEGQSYLDYLCVYTKVSAEGSEDDSTEESRIINLDKFSCLKGTSKPSSYETFSNRDIDFTKSYYITTGLRNPSTLKELGDAMWLITRDPVEEFTPILVKFVPQGESIGDCDVIVSKIQ